MPEQSEYLDVLLEWLSPLGTVASRSMLGGHCLYCDGVVFALVADNTLHLKVDEAVPQGPQFCELLRCHVSVND